MTCPLEVVKTRLQSSNAFIPVHASRISELPGMQNATTDALRRPEQRRKFSSTILRRVRPQVNAKFRQLHQTHLVCVCPPNSFSLSVPFQKSPTKAFRKNFFDKIRLKKNVKLDFIQLYVNFVRIITRNCALLCQMNLNNNLGEFLAILLLNFLLRSLINVIRKDLNFF